MLGSAKLASLGLVFVDWKWLVTMIQVWWHKLNIASDEKNKTIVYFLNSPYVHVNKVSLTMKSNPFPLLAQAPCANWAQWHTCRKAPGLGCACAGMHAKKRGGGGNFNNKLGLWLSDNCKADSLLILSVWRLLSNFIFNLSVEEVLTILKYFSLLAC